MTVTSNNSGTSLYHYSKRILEETRVSRIYDKTMSRKQRRKLERKLGEKINKYLNEKNQC